MNVLTTGAPTALMILTRDVPSSPENGRGRTLSFIHSALAAGGVIHVFRLTSLLERRTIGRFIGVGWAWLFSIVRLRPIPLQVLLFHDSRNRKRLIDEVNRLKPLAVYIDGVRCGLSAEWLRREFPEIRMICDFDDLLSRRMDVLSKTGQRISLGYMKTLAPSWVQTYILDGLLGSLVLAYERRALRSMENRVRASCDAVVLVSSVEASHLREISPTPLVEAIPPVVDVRQNMDGLPVIERFAFVGSDRLLQNRLSIDYLLNLWERDSPTLHLQIFGKQERPLRAVPNVDFKGFVADVADAYSKGTVVLAPSFLSGGVKTKVLEAMSFGVIPIGTQTTFEGIDAPTDALIFSDEKLQAFVRDPSLFRTMLEEAGRHAIHAAAANHSPERLGERWRRLVWPKFDQASISIERTGAAIDHPCEPVPVK